MKKILLGVVVIAGALLVWNYMSTGRVTLIPGGGGSSEEQQRLDGLEQRLRAASQQFQQAARAAATAGLDMTADAEAARLEVERVERELRELEKTATGEIREGIRRLDGEIAELKRRMGS